MNTIDDPAARLLRETFADAERLLGDEPDLAAAAPPRGPRRTPVALLAAAAVIAVLAGGYGGTRLLREPGSGSPPVARSVTTTAGPQAKSTVHPHPAPTGTSSQKHGELPVAEQVRIYVAVLRELAAFDRPETGWPALYVVDAPYRGIGVADPAADTRLQPFSAEMRESIERQLGAVPDVRWVSRPNDAGDQQDPCRRRPESGPVLTLGEIRRVGDHVEIASIAWLTCQAAHFQTYRLDAGPGGQWRVSGTVGPQGIS